MPRRRKVALVVVIALLAVAAVAFAAFTLGGTTAEPSATSTPAQQSVDLNAIQAALNSSSLDKQREAFLPAVREGIEQLAVPQGVTLTFAGTPQVDGEFATAKAELSNGKHYTVYLVLEEGKWYVYQGVAE